MPGWRTTCETCPRPGRAIRRASASACSRPSSRSWTRRRSATRCCSCWTISTGRTARFSCCFTCCERLTFRCSWWPRTVRPRWTRGAAARSSFRLPARAGTTPIEVHGLDEAETVRLVEEAVGHEVGQTGVALARELRRETEEPVLRNRASPPPCGTGRGAAGGATLEARARHRRSRPSGAVHEVVTQRVARLGPDAERTLRTAALIGAGFDFELLAHCRRA